MVFMLINQRHENIFYAIEIFELSKGQIHSQYWVDKNLQRTFRFLRLELGAFFVTCKFSVEKILEKRI